jgi:hypothetical protein
MPYHTQVVKDLKEGDKHEKIQDREVTKRIHGQGVRHGHFDKVITDLDKD